MREPHRDKSSKQKSSKAQRGRRTAGRIGTGILGLTLLGAGSGIYRSNQLVNGPERRIVLNARNPLYRSADERTGLATEIKEVQAAIAGTGLPERLGMKTEDCYALTSFLAEQELSRTAGLDDKYPAVDEVMAHGLGGPILSTVMRRSPKTHSFGALQIQPGAALEMMEKYPSLLKSRFFPTSDERLDGSKRAAQLHLNDLQDMRKKGDYRQIAEALDLPHYGSVVLGSVLLLNLKAQAVDHAKGSLLQLQTPTGRRYLEDVNNLLYNGAVFSERRQPIEDFVTSRLLRTRTVGSGEDQIHKVRKTPLQIAMSCYCAGNNSHFIAAMQGIGNDVYRFHPGVVTSAPEIDGSLGPKTATVIAELSSLTGGRSLSKEEIQADPKQALKTCFTNWMQLESAGIARDKSAGLLGHLRTLNDAAHRGDSNYVFHDIRSLCEQSNGQCNRAGFLVAYATAALSVLQNDASRRREFMTGYNAYLGKRDPSFFGVLNDTDIPPGRLNLLTRTFTRTALTCEIAGGVAGEVPTAYYDKGLFGKNNALGRSVIPFVGYEK